MWDKEMRHTVSSGFRYKGRKSTGKSQWQYFTGWFHVRTSGKKTLVKSLQSWSCLSQQPHQLNQWPVKTTSWSAGGSVSMLRASCMHLLHTHLKPDEWLNRTPRASISKTPKGHFDSFALELSFYSQRQQWPWTTRQKRHINVPCFPQREESRI